MRRLIPWVVLALLCGCADQSPYEVLSHSEDPPSSSEQPSSPAQPSSPNQPVVNNGICVTKPAIDTGGTNINLQSNLQDLPQSQCIVGTTRSDLPASDNLLMFCYGEGPSPNPTTLYLLATVRGAAGFPFQDPYSNNDDEYQFSLESTGGKYPSLNLVLHIVAGSVALYASGLGSHVQALENDPSLFVVSGTTIGVAAPLSTIGSPTIHKVTIYSQCSHNCPGSSGTETIDSLCATLP
jgi:hypothetical protein